MRHRWFSVVGWLCFLLLATGARAQYGYVRPTNSSGGPPTNADLEIYDGASHSISVELLNLTPYNIQFNHNPGVSWSITAADEAAMQDTNPTIPKSFMFVPVGVPSFIPGLPPQAFLNPGDPGYDPNYVDTGHPYPMVFSWDDQGGFTTDNWVTWTIKGVQFGCEANPPGCVPQTQDVHLGLWMDRIKPSSNWLTSAFLPQLGPSLLATVGVVKILFDPGNPGSWISEFLALGQLGLASYNTVKWAQENTKVNDGNTMWVASYVIPNAKSPCVLNEMTCAPSTMSEADTGDAVYSQWGAALAGPERANGTAAAAAAEADLIVTVHVLRGQMSEPCPQASYPNQPCLLGSESSVMITVMRPTEFAVGTLDGAVTDSSVTLAPNSGSTSTLTANNTPPDPVRLFLLQAGAARIRQLLRKHGDTGLQLLRSVIQGLTGGQRLVLRQMLRDMGSGRRPTLQERRVVHLIANDLQARLLEAGLN